MAIVAMRRSQLGVEAVYGTAVAPSRQLQGALSLQNNPERVLRDERRASMGGPLVYDDLSHSGRGTYTGRAVVDELVYFMCGAIGTPTPAAGVWTFDQPMTRAELDAMPITSLTAYAGEAEVESFRMAGVYVQRLVITGADRGAWTVSHDLIGREMVVGAGATNELDPALLTPSLPTIKTLMSTFSIADTGAGIPGSAWANTVFSFTWTFNTGIVQEYTADATLDPAGHQRDLPTCTLEVIAKFSATSAGEYAEYHADGGTKRFIRITGTDIIIDGCYVQTDYVPLDAERDGTQLSRLTFTAIEDLTWGSKIKAALTSSVAAGPV